MSSDEGFEVENDVSIDDKVSAVDDEALAAIEAAAAKVHAEDLLAELCENLFKACDRQGIKVTLGKSDAEELIKKSDWHVGQAILLIKRQQRLQPEQAEAVDSAVASDDDDSELGAADVAADPAAAAHDAAADRSAPEPAVANCNFCGHYRTCAWCTGQAITAEASADVARVDPVAPMVEALETILEHRRLSAKSYVHTSANEGHAWAQYARAVAHSRGDSLPKDDARAAELYQLAAAQGFAPAQCILGQLCQQGSTVVPKDYTRAASLYGAAADAGLAQAQCNLARMHIDGVGVRRDSALAAELFERAAAQGHPQARTHLAILYQQGRGVSKDGLGTKDEERAAALCKRARQSSGATPAVTPAPLA